MDSLFSNGEKEHSFRVYTTVTNDGKVIQELHGSDYKQLMACTIETQKQHIIDALISLGWTPPKQEEDGESAAASDD